VFQVVSHELCEGNNACWVLLLKRRSPNIGWGLGRAALAQRHLESGGWEVLDTSSDVPASAIQRSRLVFTGSYEPGDPNQFVFSSEKIKECEPVSRFVPPDTLRS